MTPTQEQLQAALDAVNNNELHTLEYGVAGYQHERTYGVDDLVGEDNLKLIKFALRFAAKALGELSTDAVRAAAEAAVIVAQDPDACHCPVTAMFKAMIEEIKKECENG